MAAIFDSINNYFKKDFKRQFILYSILPLSLSLIFLFDFLILPEINKSDSISQLSIIKTSQNFNGRSYGSQRDVGYRYFTKNDYTFSSLEDRIQNPKIQLTLSPLFKTVKTVTAVNDRNINLASGFNGLNKLMLLTTNFVILISILYLSIKKEITENARLNIIFLNLLLLIVWIYAMVKFHG